MTQYQHKEAFCLMRYACTCGHREIFWNSRDGITPFCTACPSCGEPDLHHVDFHWDRCTPNHQPHRGQRVWVNMTMDRARAITRYVLRRQDPNAILDPRYVENLAIQAYNEWGAGTSPDLKVWGYESEIN